MGMRNIEKKIIKETTLLLAKQFENFVDKHELSEKILLLLQELTNYFEWSVGLNKGDVFNCDHPTPGSGYLHIANGPWNILIRKLHRSSADLHVTKTYRNKMF